MEKSAMSTEEVVQEIMRIHRSLPARPGIEEVEAARTLIANVEREDQSRIEAISRQAKGKSVPEELFSIFQEMQRSMVYFNGKEQMREAMKLLDLENVHSMFDDLILRASKCLSSPSSSASNTSTGGNSESVYNSSGYSRDSSYAASLSSYGISLNSYSPATSGTTTTDTSNNTASSVVYSEKDAIRPSVMMSKDDSYVQQTKGSILKDGFGVGLRSGELSVQPQIVDSTLKPVINVGQDGDKLSLIKLASLIEVSAKKGTRELNLERRLMDQVDWLPDSLGKLTGLITLNLAENRIVALPNTIGGLSSLQKLDLRANKIVELPESVGDMVNLVNLNLSGNLLKSLPATFARLVHLQELDLSSNSIHVLPDTIGSLVSLKILNVETNDIEEIPHSIGQCTLLAELRADYNRLKALPEAVGRIGALEVLSVRYNNLRQLPTTMASLFSLRELDVSFNELEAVPESLCFATTLVKMNISNNFADLRYLPRSIGNLEMLEELNMSNNQIRVLPDSFRMLSKLRILNTEGNPLEMPPKDILDNGAQAVVQYMADLVAKRDIKPQSVKQKKSWVQICCFSRSNKRKRSSTDYVVS